MAVPKLAPGEVRDMTISEAIGTVKNQAHSKIGASSLKVVDDPEVVGGCITDDLERSGAAGNDKVVNFGFLNRAGGSGKDKFLDGVVEVETDSGAVLTGLNLQLVDEVLMSVLGELATFGGVEVNVVGIHLETGIVGNRGRSGG
jgi:hypothetical protein